MARVVAGAHRGSLDPLKHSEPLGGALVFLGLHRTMPVLHGSKGCASFAKALLTRHFREAVPMQTTAVTEVDAVLGTEQLLAATLDAIAAKQRPEIIGLLTTGLTEISGQDLQGDLRAYRERRGDGPLVVEVSTPDFRGGLSQGWSAALEALVRAVPLDAGPGVGPGAGTPVAVLVGPTLVAADLDELRDLFTAFGCDPILVPDLSGSLDGHLDDAWSPVTSGGTSLADLRRLGTCPLVVSIGTAARAAADALAVRTGARVLHHRHLTGLAAVDGLVADLLIGAPPARVARARARLADGLLDAHFVLGGARVAVAGEPDLLAAAVELLHGVGAEVVAAVSPTDAPVLAGLPCAEVVVGDLADLEDRAREGGAELVLGSGHARAAARRVGAAHLTLGFPAHDRLGSQLRSAAGYAGSLRLVVDCANALLEHHETRPTPARAASRAPSDAIRSSDVTAADRAPANGRR